MNRGFSDHAQKEATYVGTFLSPDIRQRLGSLGHEIWNGDRFSVSTRLLIDAIPMVHISREKKKKCVSLHELGSKNDLSFGSIKTWGEIERSRFHFINRIIQFSFFFQFSFDVS